ncbi:MAG: carboxypeptidase regulatory-like domain-containing protein [Gemmatimonadales bacterium]
MIAATTVTDPFGDYFFVLPDNSVQKPGRISASATGLDCGPTISLILDPNFSAEVNFTCRPPRATVIVNVTSGGSPLAEAAVTLRGPDTQTLSTGSDGKATFTGLAPGSYDVIVLKTGFNCGTGTANAPSGGTAQVDVVCTPLPGTVVVTVQVSGSPTPGVSVTINGPSGPGGTIGPDGTVTLTQTKMTGQDGKATFSDVPPGTYDITATQQPLSCPSTTATVGPGDTKNVTIECTPPTTGTINVDVKRMDGTPVPGLLVTLTSGPPPVSQSTDTNGRATFTNVTPGSYTLRFAGTPFGLNCPDKQVSVGPGATLTVTETCTSP